MQFQHLHQYKPLEDEMATHSSVLAWESLGQRSLGGVQSIGLQSQTWLSTHECVRHDQQLKYVLLFITWDVDKIIQYPCTQGWTQWTLLWNSISGLHWYIDIFSECDPLDQVFQAFSATICILISFMSFPGRSVVKNLPANARDVGLIPGSGRSPGEGNSSPLQYSCLGNPIDRGARQAYRPWSHKKSDIT